MLVNTELPYRTGTILLSEIYNNITVSSICSQLEQKNTTRKKKKSNCFFQPPANQTTTLGADG